MCAKHRELSTNQCRLVYFLSFFLLLLGEILIGVFVHDQFVRPYLGDALVTVLLCCLLRCIWPEQPKLLPLYVFLFSAAVECLQLWNFADRMHITNRFLRTLIGTTFDWKDIVCYFCGCLLFGAAEAAFRSKPKRK